MLFHVKELPQETLVYYGIEKIFLGFLFYAEVYIVVIMILGLYYEITYQKLFFIYIYAMFCKLSDYS